MDPKKTENIDELQKGLYNRDFKSELPPTRQHFSEHDVDVDKGWQHNFGELSQDPNQKTKKVIAGSFFKKVLTISLIFFIISAGLLTYMFLGGWNIISANNVDITFLGPVTIAAGDELNFEIVIDNQNRSAIEEAVLYINYPDGTKEVEDITQEYTHDRVEVGEVLSKSIARRTSRSVLFGELNSHQEIKVALEYGIKNSNATFRKEKTYDITISSTPLTVTVSHPEKAISNENVEFVAAVTSNSSVPLTNLLLKVDYPFGFTYESSDPEPTYEDSYWLIETLNPGEKKEFQIAGTIEGEHNDERVFRYTLGAQDPTNEQEIVTRYLSQPESIFIQRPPLGLRLALDNNSSATYIIKQGDQIYASMEVVNNLPVRIVNARVALEMDGEIFNPSTVRALGAFYQSQDNTLVWDKNTTSKLASLEPGEKVLLTYSFGTYPVSESRIKNGMMSLKVVATGERAGVPAAESKVESRLSRSIRTQTSIGLVSNVSYSTGPFRNRGPIPPEAEQKTTYTVTWTAINTTNDVRGAEVRANLPNFVRWVDVSHPQSETITWNPDKNEVVWRVGDIAAGTGGTKASREVSFQIELEPSRSQIGSNVDLVRSIEMTAIDSFTNAKLTATSKDLTTVLTNDPQYNDKDGEVVE